MITILKPSKLIYTLTIAIVYLLIPILILVNILDFRYKFFALTFGTLLVYILMRLTGISNDQMGITKKHGWKSVLDIAPVTVTLLIVGFIAWTSGWSRFEPNESLSFYLFYIFISSPTQELLYRGILPVLLDSFRASETTKFIATSSLYSFAHVIYRDPLTLLLTFAIGLIWYQSYRRTHNLLGVGISHAALGLATIAVGAIN